MNDQSVTEKAWRAHLATKRSSRQARRSSFDAGFLAGHEAATRTRAVTVERLADELCRASAVWNGHPYAGDVPCDQHKYEAEVVLPLLHEPEEDR